MKHDFSAAGSLAVECPRCRLEHGAYLSVVRADGSPLECREYSYSERQHITDHIAPEHWRAQECRCGLRPAPRVATFSLLRPDWDALAEQVAANPLHAVILVEDGFTYRCPDCQRASVRVWPAVRDALAAYEEHAAYLHEYD